MFINLTPHPVNVVDGEDRAVLTIQPEPTPARVATTTSVVGTHDGVPIIETAFGEVTDLPEPQAGTLYVVARLVIQAAPDRTDLVAPGDLVRDGEGRIVGCRNFSR